MKVVNIVHKTATGSNRNGTYSVSTCLTDSNLSRNEFTILFTYVQVDVKRNIALVNSIRFPRSVKILSIKRCGEEDDESETVGTDVVGFRKAMITTLRGDSTPLPSKPSPRTVIIEVKNASGSDKSDASGDDETSHRSAQLPDYHTKLGSPHEYVVRQKKNEGSWVRVNSNSVDNIFLEPPKNNRLYSFYLIIECEGTVRSPYFDIIRNNLTMDSRCILLNEENSEGSEAAEIFIGGVGNLKVYKVIIDEYVVSSNCKSLVLKSMFSDILSKIRSYKRALATINDPATNKLRTNVKVVVFIGPNSVTITPMSGVFVTGQVVSLRAVFCYPVKS